MDMKKINRGPKHRCRVSGDYFYEDEMEPYWKGGWVAKKFNHYIDQVNERSKYGNGLYTQRGFN